MAEADAEDGDRAAERADERNRDARLRRRAGAGAEDHRLGLQGPDVLHGELVVPVHLHLAAERLDRLDEVEGEGVVVVDDENHRPASSPAMATSAARSLCAVSWYSASGMLSWTMPAPAWKRSRCPLSATLRMTMARSMSPSKPTYPAAPA